MLILVTLLLAMAEELRWRGYLLPVLQTRYGAATASLLLGAAWFVWHILLRFLPGDTNAAFPLGLWGLSFFAAAVVYTWLYNNTGGSVLAATVFHGLLDTIGPFVVLHPSVTGTALSAGTLVSIYLVLALVIVLTYGPRSFTRMTPVVGDSLTDDESISP